MHLMQLTKDCEWESLTFGCIGLEASLPLMVTNMVRTNKLFLHWSCSRNGR